MTRERPTHDRLASVTPDAAAEHAYAREQLPWYLNGTLEEVGRGRVATHLAACADCRAQAAMDAVLREQAGAQPAIDLAPQAGLAAVMQRIERRERRRRWTSGLASLLEGARGQRPLTFAVALQSLVIVILALLLFVGPRPGTEARYRALSSPAPASNPAVAEGARLRVVFAEELTLGELRALLAPLGLRIVAGPGEAGIYTVATDGEAGAALDVLRAHPGVRLAEPAGAS